MSVMAILRGLDRNAPAIGFYDRMGASTRSEWLKRHPTGKA